jgi:short-subunit dehydrogenase
MKWNNLKNVLEKIMSESKFPPATPLKPRRRAVIVGASSGIGAALARKLAQQGYSVALLARREKHLKTLCDEINTASGETRACYYVHDVTDTATIPDLLQRILKDLGGLDLFVYNTGIQNFVRLDEFNFTADREMMEINTMGALAWLNPVAAIFYSLKTGHIVGISSVAGDRGRVAAPAYNTSKAALTTYLEALRNRLTRRGVTVLTVKPGFVETDILKAARAKRTFWVISPEQAAEGIWKAIQAHKQTVYVPGQWGLLMLVIQHIPSIIFRRLSF